MNYKNADKILSIPTEIGIRVAREELEYWTLLFVAAVEQEEKRARRGYIC